MFDSALQEFLWDMSLKGELIVDNKQAKAGCNVLFFVLGP
jgi:hypothetical protein